MQVALLFPPCLGINTFRFLPVTRLVKVIYIHTFILTLGAVVSVVGSCLAAVHKKEFINNGSDAHLYSLHSWLGLSGYILMGFCVQMHNTSSMYAIMLL